MIKTKILCSLDVLIKLTIDILGSPEGIEKIMDQIENYIMTRLYKTVFCPETTDDEKKDLAVQKRIR